MNRTLLSLAVAALTATASASAQDAVSYSVEPVSTYPARGASVESLDRVVIDLGRGFGPVGFNTSATTRVYIEDETGNRIDLVNAVGGDLDIDAGWRLDEFNGASAGSVHTYKDCLYNDLFTRSLGWNGGDGVLTVGLPGGHVYWTFNDSFYGVVNQATRARGACSFPRNTIMAQVADEAGYPVTTDEALLWLADFQQTDRPNANGYYKALTHIDNPKAVSFNDDGIAQDYLYWSGDGAIVDGKLQMLWNGVHTPGDGSMIGQNTALAIYSLDGEPGDDSYLKLESVNHNFRAENPYGYGSTVWEDEDGHIYLYSSAGNGQWLGNDPIVARTLVNSLDCAWEYYIADRSGQFAWQRRYPTEAEVQRSGIAPRQGSLTLPWVFKKGNRYFMCAQTFPFGHEMVILTADNPWGPFTDRKFLISFPNPLDPLQHDPKGDKYQNLYMLNLHPALSREGELVISTNTDIDDFWRNFNDPGSADWYRPFFYRVYGWENLFNDTMKGASDRVELVTADGRPITTEGHYRLVCEQGAFGDEKYEAGGFTGGVANKRLEVNFTIGTPSGIVTPSAATAAPVYYNLQGLRVDCPTRGIYLRRQGDKVEKVIL